MRLRRKKGGEGDTQRTSDMEVTPPRTPPPAPTVEGQHPGAPAPVEDTQVHRVPEQPAPAEEAAPDAEAAREPDPPAEPASAEPTIQPRPMSTREPEPEIVDAEVVEEPSAQPMFDPPAPTAAAPEPTAAPEPAVAPEPAAPEPPAAPAPGPEPTPVVPMAKSSSETPLGSAAPAPEPPRPAPEPPRAAFQPPSDGPSDPKPDDKSPKAAAGEAINTAKEKAAEMTGKPEVLVGLAFVGGFIGAQVLKLAGRKG